MRYVMPLIVERPKRSELLMPAGNLEKLKIAVLYGADAIYMGTPDMSLRSKSEITLDDAVEGVEFAHKHGKRVYLTLNLFSHNKDIPKLPEYIETIRMVKPDGVIIADPGVFQMVKEQAPELELHVSTQANICSWLSVDFWQKQGASLCVMAREVSFPELTEIREKCPTVKLEAFVHGAMCMTYSGRCLLSNFMAERGANQGSCANSCRWNYKVHMRMKDNTVKEIGLTEETRELFEFFLEEGYRPGEYMQLEEDDRGSYILNSKDLCLLPHLDDYMKLGVDSLKVEGRNKSAFYVSIVARAYRMAIDDWYKDPENWNPREYMEELYTVPNRGYTFAFHEGRLTNHSHNYEDTKSLAEFEYAGIIREVHDDAFIVEIKNKLEAGDVLEFMPPCHRKTICLRMYEFENAKTNNKTDVVVQGKQPFIRIPFDLFDHMDVSTLKKKLPELTMIRKEKSLTAREWERLKMDKSGQQMEQGNAPELRYEKAKSNLIAEIKKGNMVRKPKTPRFGVVGCCGKGCNGCLVFWHDDGYAKARALLAEKQQGELLESDLYTQPLDIGEVAE